MTEPKKKTIQELMEKVHSGIDLSSEEDLAALFEEVPAQQVPTPSQGNPGITPNEPPKPNAAPNTPAPAPGEEGQAGLLNILPEKFRKGDDATSVASLAQSYTDLETEHSKTAERLAQAERRLQELDTVTPEVNPLQVAQPGQVTDEEEIDDATFFEKATESARKIARQEIARVLPTAFQQYDTFSLRRTAVAAMKRLHPDFDNFRSEMLEVIKEHPEWDADIRALPKIYDSAKQKAATKFQAVNPSSSVQAPVDVEKLKDDIRKEMAVDRQTLVASIVDEIKKRKSAAGVIAGSQSTTVEQRVVEQPRTTPKTPEEEMFDEMLASGPNRLVI